MKYYVIIRYVQTLWRNPFLIEEADKRVGLKKLIFLISFLKKLKKYSFFLDIIF